MRAVNLMPADQRRGGAGGAGRSAGGAYIVLGLLAGFVALAGLYGIARHQVSDRTAQAARLTAQAAQAQARADSLKSYTSFITVRDQRVQAVEQLAASRFDWPHAFHEIGRVLPVDVALTSMTGTVAAAAAGAAPPAAGASAAGAQPTIEISGCAVSQPVVAQTLERLRGIDGVTDVSLQSSDRSVPAVGSSVATSSAAAPTGPSDCRQGHPQYPLFKITTTFSALPSATPPAAAGAAPGAAAAAPAGGTAKTPAAGTTASTPAAATPAAATTPAATPAATSSTK